MKIVDRKTFLSLPPDTLFSKFEPCVFGELSIKGETIGEDVDFYSQSIADSLDWDYFLDFMDICSRAKETGESIKMDFDSPSRDGLFEENQLFAIWETEDVKALILRLEKCIKGGE